jgi:ankyrin repeat protein
MCDYPRGRTARHWRQSNRVQDCRLLSIRGRISAGSTVRVYAVSSRADHKGISSMNRQSKNLFEAARLGDMTAARWALHYGADVHDATKNGHTPLHCTSSCELAALLIEAGANANARDNEGMTPLHPLGLVREGSLSPALAKLLIGAGANINSADNRGNTPLHYHSPEIKELLVEAGADANARNARGETPLHTARLAEVASLLISAGANVHVRDEAGETPLHHAINEWLPGPVDRAAEAARRRDLAEVLIRAGSDIHARDRLGATVAHSVAFWNEAPDGELMSILIGAGADVNATAYRRRTPLHFAAGAGSRRMVRILLKAGAAIDSREECGATPLHRAAEGGYKLATAFLIENGADVNSRDNSGWTPLHYAARDGSRESKFARGEARPSDSAQERAEHEAKIAALPEATEILEYLLKSGADPLAIDSNGELPHAVARLGNQDFLRRAAHEALPPTALKPQTGKFRSLWRWLTGK